MTDFAFPFIHPNYKVWFRRGARSRWTECTVISAAVDMWHPRMVGHSVLSTDEAVEVKIISKHGFAGVELRPSGRRLSRQKADGSLRLKLHPKETVVLQWERDPGRCLHLSLRPTRLARAAARSPRLLRFGPGVHEIEGGSLRLQSGQVLQLDEGAVLRATVVCENVKDVTIRGLGTIDLLADCPVDPPSEQAPKQAAISILRSQHIRIEGITIRNPSHYGILLGQSRDIRIAHISVFTHCRWGDGIDSMACRDLRVEHCLVRTSDDCLAVYADRGVFAGTARGHIYRRCTLWADVAHPVMIGVHGLQKAPGRIIEELRFEHLTILRHNEPGPMYQGCLALNPGDMNTIRDCSFSDILIEDPAAPRLLDLRVLFNPAYNPVPGQAIHDVLFRRIRYRGNPEIPSVFAGHDRHRRVWQIRIDDLRINGQRQKSLPNLQTNPWAEAPVIT